MGKAAQRPKLTDSANRSNQSTLMNCLKCNERNLDGAYRCHRCGYDLDYETDPRPKGGVRVQRACSPAPVAKGEKHGVCNRGVCENPNALWFNKSTRKYYCQPCALKIMSWPENVGLLVKEEPENDELCGGASQSASATVQPKP
jgi:ribosomal protein L40E